MPILTDDEIKNLSKEIIEQPDVIQEWQDKIDSSYVKEAEVQAQDEQNKKFSDELIAIQNSFHNELAAETGVQRANYSDSNMTTAANTRPDSTPHFPQEITNPTNPDPSDIWSNLQPKKLGSNDGSETTTATVNSLSEMSSLYIRYKTMVTTGVSGYQLLGEDSSFIQNDGFIRFNGFYPPVDAFEGQYVTIASSVGVTVMLCTNASRGIYNPIPSQEVDATMAFTFKAGIPLSSHIPAGTIDIFTNGTGWSENDRTNTSIDTRLNQVRDSLDAIVEELENTANAAKAAVDSNIAGNPYGANLDARSTQLDNFVSSLGAFTNNNSLTRFNDATINGIESDLNTLNATDREQQILDALGTLVQNEQDKGAYSGSGIYFELFTWVDKRINIGEGTLFQLKTFPASRKYYTDQKTLQENILSQYEVRYLVIGLSENYESGNVISLTSVDGLEENDNVKIMDNNSQVFDRTIVTVDNSENKIVIDSPLDAALNALGQQARLFKEL